MANDILLYCDDLLIQNGDFVIGDSDQQNMADIIRSFPGDWKEFPQIGCGIFADMNVSGKEQEIAREIMVQLKADGFNVNSPTVSFVNSVLTINPNAKR